MKASQFLQKLSELDKVKLIQIKGVGEVLANNLIKFLESDRYSLLLTKFEKLEAKNKGIEVELKTKNSLQNGKLTGQTICITGSFDTSRNEIKDRLESLGAKVVDAVSSSTTILLAGEKAGSKLKKAEGLGIRIESDLNHILN